MTKLLLLILLLFSACEVLQAEQGPTVDGLQTAFNKLLKTVQLGDMRLHQPERDISSYADRLIKEYETAPNKYPTNDLIGVAVAYGFRNQPDKALQISEAILKRDPTDYKALNVIGLIKYFQKQFPEAISCFQQGWKRGDIQSLVWLGLTCLRTQDLEEVHKLVPALLMHLEEEDDVRNVLVFYSQVATPPEENLFQRAVKGMTDPQILAQEPFLPFYVAGLWDTGEQGRALNIVYQARDEATYNNLTGIPARRKAVIAAYEQHPELFAGGKIWVAAIAYMLESAPERAEPLYEQFVKLKPDEETAWGGLGMANYQLKNYEAAIKAFQKAWDLRHIPGLRGLLACHMALQHSEEIKALVPELLANKDKDAELPKLIAMYAITSKPPDKELFLKAIEGLDDSKILEETQLAKVVITGLRLFGQAARGDALELRLAKRTPL